MDATPHAQSQVAASPPAGVAADEYVAKAAPTVVAANATSPNSTTKTGKSQSGVPVAVTPSISAGPAGQEASTPTAAARVQPRTSSATGDRAAASSSDAPTTATSGSSRLATAKPPATMASKTPITATAVPSSEASMGKDNKSPQNAAPKNVAEFRRDGCAFACKR